MIKKLHAFSIVAIVTLITAVAGAGAGIYSWAGWHQPEAPKELQK